MTEKQFLEISQWQKDTFGQANAFSKLQHLKQEVNELEFDIINDGHEVGLEFADCFFLLFGAAAAAGMTYADIVNCIDRKFIINKSRKWGKPDENGVVKHINPDELTYPDGGGIFLVEGKRMVVNCDEYHAHTRKCLIEVPQYD